LKIFKIAILKCIVKKTWSKAQSFYKDLFCFFDFLMNVKQIATKQLLGVPAFDKKVQFCPKNIG